MSAPLRLGLRRLSSVRPLSSSFLCRSSPLSTNAVFTEAMEATDDDFPQSLPPAILARSSVAPLTLDESHRSVLDLYRKICRLLPQVLKGYELEGEDSYHRGIRNVRFHFEHHRALSDRHVVEVLRHKAEMEIEESLLMHKTKSHVAALLFEEPMLSSVARRSREQRSSAHSNRLTDSAASSTPTRQEPSPFLQDFLAGTA